MLLRDVTFVVTDTETTGTDAGRDRVIELAAVKVRGGEVVDQFVSLINPGRSIPGRITRLTGITTGMVFDQPTMAEVLPQYLDFLDDGVFVAHNVPFDQGFLDAELARLDRPSLGGPMLCTLRLARRLLPGLRSKSLSSLSKFYSLGSQNHRALGDAESTAEVLGHFLTQLSTQHGLGPEASLDDLLAFQNRTYRRTHREAKHLRRIREEVLPQLPSRPGVYFMKDRHGSTIYIGKAKVLRDRVRSYFTAIEAHARRTRDLVDAVRDIEWTETGSELGALLLESRLIKAQQPRFNRAQRRYRSRPFLRLDASHPFPRVTFQSYLMDDGAEYFGPLGGRKQAERVIAFIDRFYRLRECTDDVFKQGRRCLYAELDRCDAPCETQVQAPYAGEVARIRAFLTGHDRTPLEQLETEMRAAAVRQDYEAAATYRDWFRTIESLLDHQQCIATPVLDHNGVLLLDGVAPGTRQLLMVRFGRHVETVNLAADPEAEALADVRRRLIAHFDPALPRPERYLKPEIDEVRVLTHWMYVHRDDTDQLLWTAGTPPEAFADDVLARLAATTIEEDEG